MIERVTDSSFLCDGVKGVGNISVYLNNLQVAYWICIKHRHESKQDLKKKYTSYSFNNNIDGAIMRDSCKSIDDDIIKVLSKNPTKIYEITPILTPLELKAFQSLTGYKNFENLFNSIYIFKNTIAINNVEEIPEFMQYLQPTETGWKISDLSKFTAAVRNKNIISENYLNSFFVLGSKSAGTLGLRFTYNKMKNLLNQMSGKEVNENDKWNIEGKTNSSYESASATTFNVKSQDWDAMCEQLFYKNMNIDSICLGSIIDRNNHIYLYHDKYG